MKILLLFSDPEYLKGKMYPFELLAECFREHGHQCLLWSMINYKKIPKLGTYQALIMNNYKLRNNTIIQIFKGKPMINFKSGTSIEMFNMSQNCWYGIPSSYYKVNNISKNMGKLVYHTKTFICPVYSAYQIPKPMSLTRDEFNLKYGIDVGRKLVIFLPGKLDKIVSISSSSKKKYQFTSLFNNIKWLLERIDWLQKILGAMGYELLVKNHVRDENRYCQNNQLHPKLIKDLKNCIVIDLDDGYEAVRYSDFAITIGSTICYEVYLYNLPTLELGFGKYLYRWSKLITSARSEKYYRLYGSDLVFGKVCTMDEFQNLEETLKNFSQNLPKIEDYKYRDHHPLLGETYHQSVEKMYQLLIQQIKNHI